MDSQRVKVQIASSYKRLSTVFVGTDISLVVLVMAPNMQLESSICIVLLPTVRMMTHIRLVVNERDSVKHQAFECGSTDAAEDAAYHRTPFHSPDNCRHSSYGAVDRGYEDALSDCSST